MLIKLYGLSLVAVLVASESLASPSVNYTLDKAQSTLQFVAHTKNSDVVGSFSEFTATVQNTGSKLSDLKVKVSVTTSSLNTKNDSRNKHLRSEDFLWSEKYPTATFETTKLTQKNDTLFQVEGIISIRGISKNISFETRLEQKADPQPQAAHLKGEFTLNRQEFGITYQPFFLLPRIKDEVQVKFELVAIAKTAPTSS